MEQMSITDTETKPDTHSFWMFEILVYLISNLFRRIFSLIKIILKILVWICNTLTHELKAEQIKYHFSKSCKTNVKKDHTKNKTQKIKSKNKETFEEKQISPDRLHQKNENPAIQMQVRKKINKFLYSLHYNLTSQRIYVIIVLDS